MLNHRSDRADHQCRSGQDAPEIGRANRAADSARRRDADDRSFGRIDPSHAIRQKTQIRRNRAGDPDPDREEHHQNDQPDDLHGIPPAVRLHQEIDQHRGDDATESEAEIGITHRAPATSSKPASHKHLIGDGPGEHVADDFRAAQQLVLPEPGHSPHKDEGHPHEADAHQNHAPRAKPVDDGSRQQSERQAHQQEPEQESLSDLRAREAERLHQRGIEHREPVENEADPEEQIQECGGNNPPAVEDARWPRSVMSLVQPNSGPRIAHSSSGRPG